MNFVAIVILAATGFVIVSFGVLALLARASKPGGYPVAPLCIHDWRINQLHLEYSQYCYSRAEAMYAQLDPADVAARAAAKTEQLRKDGRLQRLAPDAREREIRELILRDLEAQIPRYEDWLANRKRE